MYTIVLYPETIRMMTGSNKVTHKMTIIPRILRSYIDCVSALQQCTSHILYERSISPRQHVVNLLSSYYVCILFSVYFKNPLLEQVASQIAPTSDAEASSPAAGTRRRETRRGRERRTADDSTAPTASADENLFYARPTAAAGKVHDANFVQLFC